MRKSLVTFLLMLSTSPGQLPPPFLPSYPPKGVAMKKATTPGPTLCTHKGTHGECVSVQTALPGLQPPSFAGTERASERLSNLLTATQPVQGPVLYLNFSLVFLELKLLLSLKHDSCACVNALGDLKKTLTPSLKNVMTILTGGKGTSCAVIKSHEGGQG